LPSFFETMTAIAFCYFAEQEIDIAVLEVGMGGRLDATNIIDPLLSVITDISLDHTEWLGSTISAIAREKAGILRKDGVLITLPQHPEANAAIGEAAIALNARGVNAAAYLPFEASQAGSHGNRYALMVEGRRLLIDSPLAGEHQQRNIALAIASAVELRNNYNYVIDDAAIERGICETCWLGRLERVIHDADGISFLLDVGHNPAGAWALRRALSASGTSASTLIFGCLDDKPVEELAQILFPIFDTVVLVEVDSPRAASMVRMMDAAAATGTAAVAACSVADALRLAEESVEREAEPKKGAGAGEIVVTGSVFLVGAVRSALMRRAELHA
jgi:dihydrofolate synthase/folylpolyglutamate synthase